MELLYTAHVPSGEGPFPTVVALHGWGAGAHDLLGLAPVVCAGGALVLCPQGPIAFQVGPGAVGYGWYPLSEGRPPDAAAFAKGISALTSFIDAALERYPVDRQRLALLGFSQGGVMAYDLALRNPERYAALVALSAWMPSGFTAGIPKLPAHAHLPTLVIHGTRDPMIPIAMGRESRDRLRELGVDPCYREYDMGHEIQPDALRQLVEWLDAAVTSRTVSVD